MRPFLLAILFSLIIGMLCVQPVLGGFPPGSSELDRDTYADQLEGFWLAQSIANWTGLQTEGRRQEPPFYTDSDWPVTFDGRQLRFITELDPWKADDDTDIEYVYASLIDEYGSPLLDGSQIGDGWIEHINDFIWVSNARARALMDRDVPPPMTSLPSANSQYLRIDAQLTTEFFGTLAPGMPAKALELAELPIATTARGHAAHAAQFFVVLHSLAGARGSEMLNAAGIEQLVVDAREYIPDTSKVADIIDTVLTDYLANPDTQDWERTRDLIADRYQINDTANGFRFQGWYESSVNFGSALVCLLYGQGDLLETIRIGTLTGWDSDNPTATMGGLIGLMLGADGVRDQFQGTVLSDRYWISRTRDGMNDYLPGDPDAEDLFSMLAQRQLSAVDISVRAEGGVANITGWLIPSQPLADPDFHNPISIEGNRSANFNSIEAGNPPTATSSLTDTPVSGAGSRYPSRFVNGIECDPSGRDQLFSNQSKYYWTRGGTPDLEGKITLQVQYSQPIEADTLRFIEGDHFDDGGWFDSIVFEVLSGGVWTQVNPTTSYLLDPAIPFQRIDCQLQVPMMIDGVRIRGRAGGSALFVTTTEIDVLSTATDRSKIGWDMNGDLLVDIEDLYAFSDSPSDVNQDGLIDSLDAKILEQAVRWRELDLIHGPR